jgi:hypothetical protein
MTGWLLVAGSVAFLAGAMNPALFQVWSAPQATQLRLIAAAPTAWTVTNALFVVATVLTAAGLWLVPERVGADGLTVARVAAVVYLLAASVWLASLVFRLAVTLAAASAFAGQGSLDPAYVIADRWAGGLFSAFIYLAAASLLAFGVAVLQGALLPALAGWAAIVVGAVIAGGYALFGDMPPFVAYLPTGLLGVVLLLPGAS